jgi:long-chain fatty acid transport protein
MKNRRLNQKALVLCSAGAAVAFAASQVQAAGFEKAMFWDAHYSALAGAAQSSVTGAQSLYWNPAGLAGTTGLQINGDFSPTISKFDGNVPNATSVSGGGSGSTAVSSSTAFSPVGAAFVSYGITDQWTAGIGYYVSGGTKASYDSVDLTYPGSVTYHPPLKGDLAITELSLGTGYEVIPGLKLGAAYRIVFVKASLNDVFAASSGALTSFQFDGLSATGWNGFKVGAQWEPKDSPFGFGVTYRNRVNFTATTSNASITAAAPGGAGGLSTSGTNLGGSNGVVGVNLPFRIDSAAHYKFNPAWTGFLGYTFTNLAQDQYIAEEISGATGGTQTSTIPLGWHNQHNIRAAVEYTGIQDWALRGGYVWTNQVTPAANALPILAAPGVGHSIAVGAGHKIMDNLTADAAFEYDRDSGSVAASDNPASRTGTGDYSAKDYVVHLSATLTL